MPAADDKRQHERYDVHLAASGEVGGRAFEGHVADISLGGAAVLTPDVGYQNDQFVSLHTDGMGETRGYVRRRIPGGFALQFADAEMTEEEQKRRDEAVAAFRALSNRARHG